MSTTKWRILTTVLLLVTLAVFVIVWRNQVELQKEQERLERRMNRNPFYEPPTNSI